MTAPLSVLKVYGYADGALAAEHGRSGEKDISLETLEMRAVTAVAIAERESGLRPDAKGDVGLQNKAWGPSIGLWQIRSLNNQLDTGGLRDENANYRPVHNAAAMAAISKGGTDWTPWSVWKNHLKDKPNPITTRAQEIRTMIRETPAPVPEPPSLEPPPWAAAAWTTITGTAMAAPDGQPMMDANQPPSAPILRAELAVILVRLDELWQTTLNDYRRETEVAVTTHGNAVLEARKDAADALRVANVLGDKMDQVTAAQTDQIAAIVAGSQWIISSKVTIAPA